MGHAEADKISEWMKAFRNRLRMEYGQAMALEGFDPEVIISVQSRAAAGMLEWLDGQT